MGEDVMDYRYGQGESETTESTYKIGRPDEKGTILYLTLEEAIEIAERDKLSVIEDMETDKIVWTKKGGLKCS